MHIPYSVFTFRMGVEILGESTAGRPLPLPRIEFEG